MSTKETENLCGLKREDFQTTINGKNTDLYILKNRKGFEVAITNYGGAVEAIMVPDKDGKIANVIQGHDNIKDVINSPEPYLSPWSAMTASLDSLFAVTAAFFDVRVLPWKPNARIPYTMNIAMKQTSA